MFDYSAVCYHVLVIVEFISCAHKAFGKMGNDNEKISSPHVNPCNKELGSKCVSHFV